ncbi:DUF1801 domain-containing protein [Nonlabens ponticola]|uniref:DUF1801 domain-containing protein n=1 Tax=Nonlabens ponticola TaxID=2496866 RepID=A0A3S9MX77_9FLAO|nr:DUF1801 domain-containing protein [Nonlabens ponticola]AZQ43747.1 DUF1801 domain-containing protein [Nonlabens ponticola]
MKTKATNTTEYIAMYPQWEQQLTIMREILEDTILVPEIKWGAPCYTLKGKNLIGMVAFKHHCALWFHKGSLLSDPFGVLVNAQPGKTKMLRQMKFQQGEVLDRALIAKYVQECIDLELASQ